MAPNLDALNVHAEMISRNGIVGNRRSLGEHSTEDFSYRGFTCQRCFVGICLLGGTGIP